MGNSDFTRSNFAEVSQEHRTPDNIIQVLAISVQQLEKSDK